MKCPILSAGLVFGALVLSLPGCHQADKVKTSDYHPKKADDPTAWSDKDVARGMSDSGSGGSSLPQSSGVKGTWSSEGQDIEKSLGVGR